MSAVAGMCFSMDAPLAGLISLTLATWPLAVTLFTTRWGGCVVYPLMVLPTWFVLIVLALFSALSDDGKGTPLMEATVSYLSYFFFVHASMFLALRHRFTKAEDRYSVSLGERASVTLFALTPLVLIAGLYAFL